MPAIVIPYTSDQKPNPMTRWQERWEDYMRLLLKGFDFEHPGSPHFGYFDFPYRGDRCQVAQVFDRTWVVHAQCAWHGAEVHSPAYHTPIDHIHIGLDVEKPQGITGEQARRYVQDLQEAACSRLSSMVEEQIGANPTRILRPGPHGHVVWESIPFSPDSDDSILRAAERVTTYTRALLSAAEAAVFRYAQEHDIVLETWPVNR